MLKVTLGFYDPTSALLRDKKSYGKTYFQKKFNEIGYVLLTKICQLFYEKIDGLHHQNLSVKTPRYIHSIIWKDTL